MTLENLAFVFAQAATDASSFPKAVQMVAILVAVLVLPFWLAYQIAKAVRMPDYGFKIGLILATVACAAVVVWRMELQLGVDLRGGVILVYQIEEGGGSITGVKQDDTQAVTPGNGKRDADVDALVTAISLRLNPSGTKEIVVRPYGERQIEIVVPEVDQAEVKRIKDSIQTAGVLLFRIVATPDKHADVIALAKDPASAGRTIVRDGDKPVGRWCLVGRQELKKDGIYPLKLGVASFVLRDHKTRQLITPPANLRGADPDSLEFEKWMISQNISDVDVLMAEPEPELDVRGDDLGFVAPANDELMKPCVRFSMQGKGVDLFTHLTAENLHRNLGIVLDDTLLSAPTIQSTIAGNGQITGKFTQEEVDWLVNILRSGKLPATLNKVPSENLIDPLLGKDNIEKGKMAMMVSLAVVFVFTAVYYRFSGVVACFCLLLNILYTVAVMMLIRAPMTLPGLAGLVLTIGMAVDSNVLIFERMREEFHRGSALRMAIRNGFARAMSAIVDSNLTTLLTAIVLYMIGTDQIRGFAVTLTLGLVMSMFTAIFCARVAFEVAEKVRLISTLKMMQFFPETKIDFIGKRVTCYTISAVVIVAGLIATFIRQQNGTLLDIDFNGGSSATMVLAEPQPEHEVRSQIDKAFAGVRVGESIAQYTVTQVKVAGTEGIYWKIDSSIPTVEELQNLLAKNFNLARHKLTVNKVVADTSTPTEKPAFVPPADKQEEPKTEEPKSDEGKKDEPKVEEPKKDEPKKEEPKATEPSKDEPKKDEPKKAEPKADEEQKSDEDKKKDGNGAARALPTSRMIASIDPALAALVFAQGDEKPELKADEPKKDEPKSDEPKKDEPKPEEPKKEEPKAEEPKKEEPKAEPQPETEKPAPEKQPDTPSEPVAQGSSEISLTFEGHPISANSLSKEIAEAAKKLEIAIGDPVLTSPEWDGVSQKPRENWTIRLSVDVATAQKVVDQIKADLEASPVWHSSSTFGPKVAGRMVNKAIQAIVISLLGVLAYVWFRFERAVFGLSAVIAVIHDVLVTLGAIAFSYWLAKPLGFLMITEFKINLTIVAAFMTIVGYSLNDTIVIFDRLREIRGKNPSITADMVNLAVNQTLSRTILTFLTVFLSVLVLYLLGGESIHDFAYAMLVGTITGVYSTVYVATPLVLWLLGKQQPQGQEREAKEKAAV